MCAKDDFPTGNCPHYTEDNVLAVMSSSNVIATVKDMNCTEQGNLKTRKREM